MSAPSKLSERRLAFVSEALMLRAPHAYRAARDDAERHGVDLSADPVVPLSFDAMRERYDNLLDEWACEDPGNDLDMIAYLDLVAAIVDGEREAQRNRALLNPLGRARFRPCAHDADQRAPMAQ